MLINYLHSMTIKIKMTTYLSLYLLVLWDKLQVNLIWDLEMLAFVIASIKTKIQSLFYYLAVMHSTKIVFKNSINKKLGTNCLLNVRVRINFKKLINVKLQMKIFRKYRLQFKNQRFNLSFNNK